MPLNNENNNECCKCTTPEIYIELNQQGPQGRQGNPGVDGVSPEITVAQNTNTSYVLKIEDVNGSFTTPNLKANLPLGGVDGQMLVKLSNEDGVVGWEGNIDNFVTTDTYQTITGNKVFKSSLILNAYPSNGDLGEIITNSGGVTGNDPIIKLTEEDNVRYLEIGHPSDNNPAGFKIPFTGNYVELYQGNDSSKIVQLDALKNLYLQAGDNIVFEDYPLTNGIKISATGGEPYVLPQANATTLGGIKANEKTDEDTQAVNIDPATGLLYTKAGGSVTDAYTKAETDNLLDAKQNIITDLSTIRNGASLGATALQPGANISELTNDSNYLVNNFSNLSSEGLDKINQSKALETGSVSSDADVYADIQKYAHSTFDKSKFEIVGSPTITSDGIASGFSASNYISKNIVCDYNTSFLFRLPDFITGNDVTSEQYIYTLENFTFLTLIKNGQISFSASASKDNSTRVFVSGNVGTISPNTRYSAFISWLNNTYNIYIKGGIYNDWELLYSKTSSEKILLSGNFHYGYRTDYPTLYWKSNLDLKLNYLIADGIPVFNGNKTGTDTFGEIEIPYTLSKTGSKIVDVAYRDRVQDLYEQTGEALFYTLDEQNQNFTLPMGEIYGMITKNKEEASYTHPPATADTLGGIKVGDNLSITEDGVLNAIGSAPANMVTTDTEQTITGIKTFPAYTKFNDTIQFTGSLCRIQNEYGNNLFLDDRVDNTLHLGEESRTTILSNTVQNGSGKKFLVQGSITSGSDNLVISETVDGIQIASTNNTGNLKYWTGTEADYTAIETKNADTLYRTTDTNKVYLGTIQLGGQ